MKLLRPLPPLACATIALVCALAVPARAQEAAPSPPPSLPSVLHSLPAETVFVLNIPSANQFVETMRKNTKLGAVVFQQARIDKLLKEIEQRSPAQWTEMQTELAKHGLKTDDAYALLKGPSGVAVSVQQRPGSSPLAIIYGWLEPAGDLAERLMKAIETDEAEDAEGDPTATIEKIEISGMQVLHISEATTKTVSDPRYEGLPKDFFTWPEEQRNNWYKERAAAQQNAKPTEVDRSYFWLTRSGGRLLMAGTLPTSQKQILELMKQPDAKVDIPAVVGYEAAKAQVGQFITRAGGKDSSRTAVTPWFLDSSIAGQLPGGVSFMDLYCNPQPLVELMRANIKADEAKAVDAFRLDKLGPCAMRVSLEGSVMRMGGLMTIPAPRELLWSLVDLEPVAPEPPAWVPASAEGFGSFAIDLSKIYAVARGIASAIAGPEADQNFAMAEMQIQQSLQIPLSELLASFGPAVHSVAFPGVGAAPTDPTAGNAPVGMNPLAGLQQPQAFVWPLRSEEPLKKLMQFVEAMSANSPMVKKSEEQGFAGYRFDAMGMELGWFLGRGVMVVAIGTGATEQVLSVLRTPPEASASFAASPAFQRGKELLAPRSALMNGVTNNATTMETMYPMLLDLLRGQLASEPLPPGAPPIEVLFQLLPTVDEIKGAFGVSTGHIYATPTGLRMDVASEYPPGS